MAAELDDGGNTLSWLFLPDAGGGVSDAGRRAPGGLHAHPVRPSPKVSSSRVGFASLDRRVCLAGRARRHSVRGGPALAGHSVAYPEEPKEPVEGFRPLRSALERGRLTLR